MTKSQDVLAIGKVCGQAGLYRRFWEERQQARHWKLGASMTDALPVLGK